MSFFYLLSYPYLHWNSKIEMEVLVLYHNDLDKFPSILNQRDYLVTLGNQVMD